MLPRARVASLLFLSGLCALVYQTAWMRLFRLLFGASTAATAATLAVFMGGLGLGGWLLGKRVERDPAPLRLYGNLELVVAVLAAASVGFFEVASAMYRATGGSQALGVGLASAVRLGLAALVMGPAAVLMGATLPAAARAVTGEEDRGRTGVALLLGVNTLGAVTGVLLTNFLLLEALGTVDTLTCAALVNALVGLLARVWARNVGEVAGVSSVPGGTREVRDRAAPLPFVLLTAAVAGFAFMLLELCWYRMLGPILGGSTYTFGLVLAVALAGLGMGGALYAAVGQRYPATLAGLAFSCAAEALAVLVPYALGDRVALAAGMARTVNVLGFPWLVGSWGLLAGLVVLPAALVAGFQFPLLIALLGRGRAEVGREVGLAYAANTAGSLVGSLAGGFGLLPWLGVLGAWRLSGAVLLGVALGAVGLLIQSTRQWRAGTGAVLTSLLALGCFAAEGPTALWRHSGIGAGRFHLEVATSLNSVRERIHVVRRTVMREQDGVESSVALRNGNGYAFLVNGKSDGNALKDAGTQVMGGLLAAGMVEAPRRALVVGLGTGSTAGWLARLPGMERVDVAEIEPVIVDVARTCADVNEGVLDNPRVKVHLEDARELMMTSREKYDVIFSEPSNPYRAGIASLYTREFYEAAASRLSDDGVLLQWLQAYEVDADTVRTVLVTLGTVFPHVEIWRTLEKDLVLRASRVPPSRDAGAVRAALAQEPMPRALRVAWTTGGLEGYLAHFVAGDPVVRALMAQDPGAINTDDVNLVEFAFARSVGRPAGFSVDALRRAALELGADRPAWVTGPVDWRRVALERVAARLRDRPGAVEPEVLARWDRWSGAASPAEAVAAWRDHPERPEGWVQRLALASALADAGDEAALTVAPTREEGFSAETEVVRARLLLAQRKAGEAADALVAAVSAVRAQVWVAREVRFPDTMTRVAEALGRSEGAAAARLFSALDTPLPGAGEEQTRRTVRQALSWLLPDPQACVAAFQVDEPHVPWNGTYLRQRTACYERASAPGAARAREELATFLSAEAPPLFLGQAGEPSARPEEPERAEGQ